MVTVPWYLRASLFGAEKGAEVFRHRISVGSKDVKALKLLSADLQKELQYELCLPYLMRTWAETQRVVPVPLDLIHWKVFDSWAKVSDLLSVNHQISSLPPI